jgi:ABC-2 type transport system ATP-binding protein
MIEVKNLVKKYGSFRAVDNVSFSVGRDQVLGFLGPNGAGKTTVMKIITGYHFPSEGAALIDGVSVVEMAVECKRRIGYLPEMVPIYGDLTVEEYLRFIADARDIPKNKRSGAVQSSLEACGLVNMRGRKIEALSKGYKQRCGLAQAILHDPPILILDEPTTGLDPNQIIEIRALIKELGRSKTVILSTHILQEVEAVCNQVLIINEGRIAAQGTPEEIALSMKGGENWDLVLKGAPFNDINAAVRALNFGGIAPESFAVEEVGGEGLVKAAFFIPAAGAYGGGTSDCGEQLFDWAVSNGFKLLQMNRKKITLEDIFVKLTNADNSSINNNNTTSAKQGGSL